MQILSNKEHAGVLNTNKETTVPMVRHNFIIGFIILLYFFPDRKLFYCPIIFFLMENFINHIATIHTGI